MKEKEKEDNPFKSTLTGAVTGCMSKSAGPSGTAGERGRERVVGAYSVRCVRVGVGQSHG